MEKKKAQWKYVFRTRIEEIERKRRREKQTRSMHEVYATFREFESGGVDPAGNSYLAHILKLETWTIYGIVRARVMAACDANLSVRFSLLRTPFCTGERNFHVVFSRSRSGRCQMTIPSIAWTCYDSVANTYARNTLRIE